MFFVGSDTLFVGLDRSQACFLRLKVYPEGHFTHLLRYFVSSLGLFFLLLRHFVSSLRLLTSSEEHLTSTEGYFASMEGHLTSSLGCFVSTEGHFASSLGYFVSTEGHRLHSDILQEAKKTLVEGSERCFQYLFLWEILLKSNAKALPNTAPATAPVRMSSGK